MVLAIRLQVFHNNTVIITLGDIIGLLPLPNVDNYLYDSGAATEHAARARAATQHACSLARDSQWQF